MKTNKLMLCLFGFVVSCTVTVASAADAPAVSLQFKTIDIATYESTQIYAINNHNQGAGVYFDSTGLQHGMLIQAGKVTTIDHPNAAPGSTFCFGINDSGVVVGYWSNAGGEEIGFQWQNGQFTDVYLFNSFYTQIYGINNSGVMTGTYYDSSAGVWNAFYGSGSNFTSFTVPGGAYYVYGDAVNDAGLITVGYFIDPNNQVYMANLYNLKTGKFWAINVPGASQTYVNGINNKNHIVYSWVDAGGNGHGAALDLASRKFYTFEDPDGTNLHADGINDNDTIVGTFLPTGDTQRQSFVATPQ